MQCFCVVVCFVCLLCFAFGIHLLSLRFTTWGLQRLSQIFAAPRKVNLLIINIKIKICTTTPRTTSKFVNVNIGFIVNYYFYLVVIL